MNPTLWRILLSYIVIITTIVICEFVTFWFYPLAVILIGNQYFTLALLKHEGVHGLIHKNRGINNFVSKYFCAFLIFNSQSHYAYIHLHHHRNLGSDEDPDRFLYQKAYSSFAEWLLISIKETVRFKLLSDFLNYFNGGLLFISGKYPFKIKTDYAALFVYWIIFIFLIFYFKISVQFLLYWFIPIMVWLPWIKTTNLFQHFHEEGNRSDSSHNVTFKNKWLQELLFPVNINLHGVHHNRPHLPYYQLPEQLKGSFESITFSDLAKKIFNSQKSKIS